MKLFLGCLLAVYSVASIATHPGKEIYENACQTCHAPKLSQAIKSPEAFDKAAWNKVFAHAKQEVKNDPKRYKTPMDYLVTQVQGGKGLMHQGGLCSESFGSKEKCTDENLISAIKYMSDRK